MSNKFEYALVGGINTIEAYKPGSVRVEGSLVRYVDRRGNNCTVAKDYFIPGTLEELHAIQDSYRKDMERKLKEFLSRFPQANANEKIIIELMFDGDESDYDITYEDIQETTLEILNHMRHFGFSNIREAYLDFVY